MLEKTKFYFAYGANINRIDMKFRCPDARPVSSFILRDWQLEFRSHATIVPVTGAAVPGVLWEITDACENSLDSFEGFPYYYIKRTWTQDGHWFFFYEMVSNVEGNPSPGYIDNILEGYQHWGLPQSAVHQALDLNATKKTTNIYR
jgi:gamma-glutamylcyclotransferase